MFMESMMHKIKTEYGIASLDRQGYYQITTSKEGNKGKKLHRLIWEDFYNKKIPDGYVIHHLNGDKTDNRIQNLQCVERSKHIAFHNKNISDETRKKRSESKKGVKNPNYGKKASYETRRKMSESSKMPHTDEHNENVSRAKNTTGYYRVSKRVYNTGKVQWRYSYYEDGKTHEIAKNSLSELEEVVKGKGLKWKKFDNG